MYFVQREKILKLFLNYLLMMCLLDLGIPVSDFVFELAFFHVLTIFLIIFGWWAYANQQNHTRRKGSLSLNHY